jgi:hypothetical protein
MARAVTFEALTAIEALRAGVPNRTAIRLMGTEQTAIEHAFDAALSTAWAGAAPARAAIGTTGIGMAGGFGTGKSHLLGYLAEVARQQGFVVSRVVVSKETPLSHPGHMLVAALRDAALPDRPDDPVVACVATLREKPEALEAMDVAVGTSKAGFAPIFSACLFLLRSPATPPETVRQIARLWSGARLNLSTIRQALVVAGARRTYPLKAIPAATLMEQLTRFAPLLFRAAGYAGWCILLDEIELIGRYTPLQRALSYAVLGAFLGLHGEHRFPGIVTAYAITDDFATAVINPRQDSEKLPERLTLKGRPTDATLARLAIRHIERAVLQNRLVSPTPNDLTVCHDKVLELYSTAYGWSAPPLLPAERTSSRTLRQYIKGWITQWDLRRLGAGDVRLVAENIASNYAEDAALAEPQTPDNDEE